MYILHPQKTQITPLEPTTFKDLHLSERKHLQEWLAKTPSALGEDLLIIQKEFDGFNGTQERLDLLALDKDGQLVIIENKLDDSGRDVVWQALKYASYCSSLNKGQIADIFQRYLDRHAGGGDAKKNIGDFLDGRDFDELELNAGKHNQRIMLVAANFRKEVTSTAMWLINHRVEIQCFKVTPWKHGSEVLLGIDQIVPPPETKDLLIALADKEAEAAAATEITKTRHTIRKKFWAQALGYFRSHDFDLYSNISPGDDHWISAGAGVRGIHYNLVFGKEMARVELVLDRRPAEENKFVFDGFMAQKNALETDFGQPLFWNRLDHRMSSRIELEKDFDGYNEANWPEITQWLLEHMRRLRKTFDKPVQEMGKKLKNQGK